jgi:hypothetical protein
MSIHLLNLELKEATMDCAKDFNNYLYDIRTQHLSEHSVTVWPFTRESMNNRIAMTYLRSPISINNPVQLNWKIINVGECTVGSFIWQVKHVQF